MKRAASVLLALALLCGLGACGKGKAEPDSTTSTVAETTTEETTETTTEPTTEEPTQKHYDPPVPPDKPSEFIYTPTYAVSKTHFYGVQTSESDNFGWPTYTLLRAPLRNISKQEEILLPKTHEGNDLGDIYICGLTRDWLFVSRRHSGYNYVTYRISVKNFKTEIIDYGEYRVAPWYNAANNSLLFLYDENLKIEALWLDTEKQEVIWDEQWGEEYSRFSHWRNTANGMVAIHKVDDFVGDENETFVIDVNNRAVPMKDYKFSKEREPHPAVKELLKQREILNAIDCNGYIYYVEYVGEGDFYWGERNLYRMKLNGSEKKLLRAKTNIFSLFVAKNKLFCLAYRPSNDETMGFYALDEVGKIISTIADGGTMNSGYGLELIDNVILMTRYDVYGNNSGYFVTLYDPATGATFSSGR